MSLRDKAERIYRGIYQATGAVESVRIIEEGLEEAVAEETRSAQGILVSTGVTVGPTGWICPKCGFVYAPFVTDCLHCNKEKP